MTQSRQGSGTDSAPFDRSVGLAFGRVAESYERRRAGYPPELVEWLTQRVVLGSGTTVVDLGAGTGKLTRALVPTGARVIAVEPLPEMRAQLEAAVPEAESLAGTAEEIPLPGGCADLVTAGAAFHWFDPDLALPEIHRVLKPGGALVIAGNGRDLTDPFQQELQGLLVAYVPAAGELLGWVSVLEDSPLFGDAEEFVTVHEQMLDAEALVERVATIGYVARLGDDERVELFGRVRALAEGKPQPIALRYRCEARLVPRA